MRRFTSRLGPTRPISTAGNQCRHHFSTLITSHVSDEVRRRFVDFAEGQSVNPYEDYLAVQEQAGTVLRKIIPQPDQEILRDFSKKGRSLVLLQNSPVIGEKGLPPTPASSRKSEDGAVANPQTISS